MDIPHASKSNHEKRENSYGSSGTRRCPLLYAPGMCDTFAMPNAYFLLTISDYGLPEGKQIALNHLDASDAGFMSGTKQDLMRCLQRKMNNE